MKVIKIKTSIRTDVEVKMLSSLHKEKSNSKIENYTRISVNSNNNNDLSTNINLTSSTQGECNIIFGDSLYHFLNTELPEDIGVTRKTIDLINQEIQSGNNNLITYEYNNLGYKLFTSNLNNGTYSNLESSPISANIIDLNVNKFIKNYNLIRSQDKNLFILLIKDSLNNVFTTTKEVYINKIKKGFSAVIKAPINDSTTAAKDGFNTNDPMFFFFKNTTRNIELKLTVTSDSNLLAADKTNIVIDKIKINEGLKKEYNNLLYDLK